MRESLAKYTLTIAIITIMLLIGGCASKRDGFLAAVDGPPIRLPEDAISPIPAYSVPPATDEEKEIVFVSRPRPKPEFIGRAPDGYEPSKIKSSDVLLQSLDLGYNSIKQATLRLSPYNPESHSEQLKLTLNAIGLHEQEGDGAGERKGETETIFTTGASFEYEKPAKIKLYLYNRLIMLSIIHDDDKEEIDINDDFNLLERIRDEFLSL